MHFLRNRVYNPTSPRRPWGRKRSYDAEYFAKILNAKLDTMAAILGVDVTDLKSNRISLEARERLGKLEEIVSMLAELYGDHEYAVGWLRTESELWSEKGDLSAIAYMAQGRQGLEVVYQTVWRLRRGEPET